MIATSGKDITYHLTHPLGRLQQSRGRRRKRPGPALVVLSIRKFRYTMAFAQAQSFDRRSFLQAGLTAAGVALAARPAFGQTRRRLAPVKVSRDRIIRELVGLRPYRDQGYRVEAEKAGTKLIIHNYGHGGAGITLSWGTAVEAIDLLKDLPAPPQTRPNQKQASRRFAVIGCGVNGLSTALMLQRRYSDGTPNVTIYARELPPDTTSNIAGGFWSPTGVYDQDYATPTFIEAFHKSTRTANRAFQLMVGKEYGVRWIDTFSLHRAEISLVGGLPGGDDLYPNRTVHRDPDNYFGAPIVRQYSTMLIEPQVYLSKLLHDFYAAGGKLVVKEFKDREEVLRLSEQVIFNCTGLGSHSLFNDDKLIPVRGQLAVLLPQPEVDYCYLGAGYMFPRTDGIILGGTFEPNNWSLTPNPITTTQILNNHTEMMKGVK